MIFTKDGGKFKRMNEKGLIDSNEHWHRRIEELQSLLADIKPILIAAEGELSERIAAISAFEFLVRSRLEPLTRRLDQLDHEIQNLRQLLRQLEEDWFFTDEIADGELYQQWRSSEEAGSAASGNYRYRNTPTRPPAPNLSADQKDDLKRIYRQLARRFHPDFALDAEDRSYRTNMMMAINAAYTVGDLKRLQELALEPDPKPQLFTEQDMAEALLKEWERCQRRLDEIKVELDNLEQHPSAELMRRREAAFNENRDLLEELADELRERIAGKMVRRDVLKEEIEAFSNGDPGFGGEDLADVVYNLGLEQVFDEDEIAGFSEWRDKNRERIAYDDLLDESAWDELRKIRDRQQKR